MMDSFWSLASGGSTVEEFARDVYIKTNLATRLSAVLKELNKTDSIPHQILTESSTGLVNDLTNAVEAAFLHGLKGKLSLSKVLASNKRIDQKQYEMDFWPVVLILSHNQVSDCLSKLNNINTDIGRCRAWIRLALNDNLLSSYMEALIHDLSLLHGFYRPSAYLRDKDHMKLLRKIFTGLDTLAFQLNYDDGCLNQWSVDTLKLIGVSCLENPLPVMPAVEALDLLNKSGKRSRKKQDKNGSIKLNAEQTGNSGTISNVKFTPTMTPCLAEESTGVLVDPNHTKNDATVSETSTLQAETVSESCEEAPESNVSVSSRPEPSLTPQPLDSNLPISGNRIIKEDGWSCSSNVTIEINQDIEIKQEEETLSSIDIRKEETYDEILHSYSSVAVLSSTPDIRDFRGFTTETIENKPDMPKKQHFFRRSRYRKDEYEALNTSDFEIISKSAALKNDAPETREFLSQIPYISNEVGLDEQDYKCRSCGRPVGMIYGKSKICDFNGFNYCLECHVDDKAIIPARVIHNWDFQKYPVSIHNYHKLQLTETEPLLDIKVLSPILYKVVPQMKDCLVLRTQLFYLHAYLFTCQESVASELRKSVWPRDHLFEHIHLYSISDLMQVHSGALQLSLRKAIQAARKHVLSCLLCSQKGFICEICKSSQIIYPFDTESTYRCDKCKAVFHSTCILEPEEKPCPRCLRIERRERAASYV